MFCAGRQHDDRNRTLAANLAQRLETIHARHHDIEQYEVEIPIKHARQTLLAIVRQGNRNLVGREIFGHESGQFLVVVNQKNGNCVHALLE